MPMKVGRWGGVNAVVKSWVNSAARSHETISRNREAFKTVKIEIFCNY